MNAPPGQEVGWTHIWSDEGFALSLVMATVATCVLAFIFGAELPLVAGLLVLGIVTAFVETRLRLKSQKK